MPKYVCEGCNKIVIRNAAVMRLTYNRSFCEYLGSELKLIRLRLRSRGTRSSKTGTRKPYRLVAM